MSSKISIERYNGTATAVQVGAKTWYFSYQTCVSFENFDAGQSATQRFMRIRRDQNHSVTTAKHMHVMGVKDWSKVDDATFERLAVQS